MTSAVDPRTTGLGSLGDPDDASWADDRARTSTASSQPPRFSPDLTGLDDGSLVDRVRSGDRVAEAEVYRRYARPVGEAVVHLLGSRSEAQDVLQDTFIDAFEQIAKLKNSASLRGWLFGIAIHKVQRRFRRRKLLATLGLDRRTDQDATFESSATDCPPEVRAELALLDRTLASLSTEQRIAWMLRRVEGCTLDEVAAACGCSLATAKRRLVAADDEVRVHFSDPRVLRVREEDE
jgi:RNA polymerase sigma-70 factor (ECF subfamily)